MNINFLYYRSFSKFYGPVCIPVCMVQKLQQFYWLNFLILQFLKIFCCYGVLLSNKSYSVWFLKNLESTYITLNIYQKLWFRANKHALFLSFESFFIFTRFSSLNFLLSLNWLLGFYLWWAQFLSFQHYCFENNLNHFVLS